MRQHHSASRRADHGRTEPADVPAAVSAVSLALDPPSVRQALRQAKQLLASRLKLLDRSPSLAPGQPFEAEAEGEPEQMARRESGLEAEVLLAHVLGSDRARLYSRPDRLLKPDELRRYEALLARRLGGEPVAYLTGHREFFGLDFFVDPRVLVPRPETELLVEQAIAEAERLARPDLRIADVGAGSGAIAVSLAKQVPTATVYAIDVSAPALAVAAVNCLRHDVAGRVTLLHGDLLSPLPVAVDVIVANLPYVSPEELAKLPPEVAGHEPSLALLAAEGGLALYRRLFAQAGPYLRPGGTLIAEIAPAQAGDMVVMARGRFPGAAIAVGKDYAGLDRVVRVRMPYAH